MRNLFGQRIHGLFISCLLAAASALLAGCGSGAAGGGAASGVAATTTAAAAAIPTLTGTVATGAPLSGATVTIKDSTGKTVAGTTTATGTFSIPVTGLTAPLMLQAAHTSLGVLNMYSVLPAMNGTTANVNITPVTTLVMYELNAGSDPGAMFRNASFNTVTSTAVGTAETTVRNGLAAKLLAGPAAVLNGVPTGFSMMYGSFAASTAGAAANPDPYDKALDNIGKITAYPVGGATLTTAGAAPVATNYAAVAVATAAPTAASVQLLVGSTQMQSSGATPVTLTAVVLDAKKQTMVGRTVNFTVADPSGSAFISNVSGASDANGVVTAKLNLGTNKANRTITITAGADTVSATGSVDVTGTTLALSGNSSLAFGAATTLTISAKDANGAALQGVTVTVTSQNGNTVALTPATGITNGSGQITATVTATNAAAADVITATAAGASKTQALTISSASFGFTTPIAATQIPINTPTPVSVAWANAGVPVAASSVNFSASRGTITGPAITNASGVANTTISSNSTGSAIITAAGAGGTPSATTNVIFVTNTASTITPQAIPGTIQVTTGSASQTSNSSTISVVVRDAANNLVKDALVNFTITTDPTNGALSSGTAITDIFGTASVTYTAGSTSSPQNGVIITTNVTSIGGTAIAAVTNTATLTVSGQALLVRLGTDNLVGVNATTGVNTKNFTAMVTDAAGNPVPNTAVQFKLRPGRFFKGRYIVQGQAWGKDSTVGATCPNEDVNFSGIVSVATDTNGNGVLDPGGAATVTATGTTDANGVAVATISYSKQYATWAEFTLEARVGIVAGNDPPATSTLILPGLATDYNNIQVAPPGQFSPYGIGDPLAGNAVCTNTK